MPYETLLLEKKENILIVTLNRPQKKNAISPKMAQELASLFHSVGHHGSSAGAMVLQGGPGLFCSGLDLAEVAMLDDHGIEHFLEDIGGVFVAIQQAVFPIIAAIDGPAVAGGFDMAVMCDIRLASPQARFGQPEINVGFTQLIDPLWKIIGLGRARELAMTGMIYGADEAYRIGLVNRLIPSEELFTKAFDLAVELAEKNPHAMAATKENCRMVPGMETIQALNAQGWVFKNFVDTKDKRQRMIEYIMKLRSKK